MTTTTHKHPLLRRCEQFRHFAQWCKAFEVFSRFALPGLVMIFMLLIITRIFQLPALPLLITIPLWLMVSLLWVQRQHKRWRIPSWRFPAYLDRHSGAKGAVLQLFETGQTVHTLPTQAQTLQFPNVFPKQLSFIWLALISGYILWYLLPAPTPAQAMQPPLSYTPLPVQQTEELLNVLAQHSAEEDEFIVSAQATLEVLKTRNNGLQPEDFTALEALQNTAGQRLQQQMAHLQNSEAALGEFEQLLAQLDENSLQTGGLNALSDELKVMQAAGMNTQQLQQLLAELQNSPNGKQQTGDTGQNGFQAAQLQALQQSIEQHRQNLQQQLAQSSSALNGAELGRGGISRGPGTAPLEFSHVTFQRETAQLDSQTFQGQRGDTVLLGQGFTARPETAQLDAQAVSGQTFTVGTDTVYWEKQTLPRHRSVIEGYFATDN